MQREDRGGVASWLVQQAPLEGQTVYKSARSKSGSLRSKVKPSLSTANTAESLGRTVSTSSVDSTSSAAGGWSSRTTAAVQSKAKTRSHKAGRIRSGTSQARTDSQTFTAGAELVTESSFLSNASFDSDNSTESRQLATHPSRLSPAKITRQGSDMSLHSQHSILDPLPEKPTDVVRHRKVFGSTYSVGKLGELPYTAPPRSRGSLTQPPWVVAANRKVAAVSDTVNREELVATGSPVGPITYGHSHTLEASAMHTEQQQPAGDTATVQPCLAPIAGKHIVTCQVAVRLFDCAVMDSKVYVSQGHVTNSKPARHWATLSTCPVLDDVLGWKMSVLP